MCSKNSDKEEGNIMGRMNGLLERVKIAKQENAV
jgi:hypothetical protein